MVNTCYVPDCDRNSEEVGDKNRHIFRAPNEAVHKWIKFLPKGDSTFNPRQHGVCVKHFEERFIQKEESVTICGEKQIFKLEPWILTSDAVPTIFGDTVLVEGTDEFEPESSASLFEDLIRFDSVNGGGSYDDEDENSNTAKRKAISFKPGPVSKKLKKEVRGSPALAEGETVVVTEGSPYGTTSNRPAHLKREIIPPSRIRESLTEESPVYLNEDSYDDIPSPPESPPSPRGGGGGRARGSGKRGRPRGSGKKKKVSINPFPIKKVEPLKIKLTTTPTSIKQSTVIGKQSDGKLENSCFIEHCNRNPYATMFKMPQMTKSKLKDWMRYIPAAALTATSFDPKIHYLCEEHFDKKFIMNTPGGKILTGDAIPSIFPNYPKSAFTQSSIVGKKGRMVPIPPPKIGRKQKVEVQKSRVEVVDGYEIEYDAESDPDYDPEPITVTIDDDDEPDVEAKKPIPVKKPPPPMKKPPPPMKKPMPLSANKPKPVGKILEIKDPGYTLQYIYDMRDRIQLPQAEVWIYRMMIDKESKTKCIFISEIVSRLERLMIRRNIKIRQDLTFKVEANGLDFTQMFNESGNKVDSLYKLQEMILDLSAFKVCEGWAQFESLDPNSTGRKIEGVWFATNCEGLNLNNNRCRPCLALKQALLARKSGLSLNSGDPTVANQIRKLPKDDPLHLQLQIQDLLKEKTKLKYELTTVEKRESRLQDRIKMLEAGMKVKGKTVYVTATAANPTSTVTSSLVTSSAGSSVSPGKPSLAVAPTSTIAYTPGSRMVRPKATTSSTSTTVSVASRPSTAPPASSFVRKQTPIIVAPTPLYPMGAQNHALPRHPHPLHHQQLSNISGVGPMYQPSILTPTFVLAQGSGHEIGHQAIETQQVLPAISLGSASLPGVHVTLQKAGSQESGSGTEEITLLSL